MAREIKLSGSEISILKSIGLSGSQVIGKLLLEKVDDVEKSEFLDTLTGLMEMGYVVSNKVNIRKFEDIDHALFRVSPVHARELREAINPSRGRDQKREHGRRQRRS